MLENYAALVYGLASGLSLTGYSFFFKLLDGRVSTGTILFIRGLIEWILPAILAIIKTGKWFPTPVFKPEDGLKERVKFWSTLCVIALLGALRLWLVYKALESLNMVEVHAVVQCTPVVVYLLGIMVGDEVTTMQILACLTLLGNNFTIYIL